MSEPNTAFEKAMISLKNMGIEVEPFSLLTAIDEQKVELVKLLLEAGVSPSKAITYFTNEGKDEHKVYPLIRAIYSSKSEAVSILLTEFGADPNQDADEKGSALIGAIENNLKALTLLLIDKGANVNHKYNGGLNALYLADKNEDKEVIEKLESAGATRLSNDEIEAILKSNKTKDLLWKLASWLMILLVVGGLSTCVYKCSTHTSSYSSSSSSAKTHTCTQCNSTYSHNGYYTIMGKEVQHETDPGYNACCSRSCAKETRPKGW